MHGAGCLEQLIKRRGWACSLGYTLTREEPWLSRESSGAGAYVSKTRFYLRNGVMFFHLALMMNTSLRLIGQLFTVIGGGLFAGIFGVLFRELVALI